MQITREIAQAIVERFASVLSNVGIDFINAQGLIIGTTSPAKMNAYDQKAIMVIKRADPLEVEGGGPEDQVTLYLPVFFNATIVGVIATSGKPDLARPIARLAKAMTEMVLHQSFKSTKKMMENRTQESFVRDLVYSDYKGNPSLERLIRREALALGYNIDIPWAVLVVEVNNLAEKTLEKYKFPKDTLSTEIFSSLLKDEVLQLLRTDRYGEIISFIGRQHFAILRPAATGDQYSLQSEINDYAQKIVQELQNRFELDATIGIGGIKSGVTGISQSFREALEAISLGRRLHNDKKVHHIDELGVARIISLIPKEIRSTIIEVFGKGRDYRALEAELLHTAKIFCKENLNASRAAEALFIHRNTLMYRLTKIKKMTGLDLHLFNHAVEFWFLYQMALFDNLELVPPQKRHTSY
ncbi:Carbohydrate diacid regulator [Neomoorella glycerini]|uniref:Carbohydrate diacid regulator n=1 Tax=Neomoorella glycerini TaxID=55779 RepID=A0A6I5ZSR2_9FIRM|nr:sugar diacid recognition domain-containing protein [Moorella glycerini]QGP93133.1 Carbohydrate diacid regulator [Moorella glycerini]